jgi:cytochrome c5
MQPSVKVYAMVVAFFCSTPQLVNAAPELASSELRAKYNLVQGKQIYERVCADCHNSGVMEAPVFCDITAWKPRIAKGMEVLVQHTIQGFNNMPSKGGLATLTVGESANAVAYMVDQCLTH